MPRCRRRAAPDGRPRQDDPRAARQPKHARTRPLLLLKPEERRRMPMPKFIIQPHFRLHEWVAEEKGYFADEGLDYEFRETFDSTDGKNHAAGRQGRRLSRPSRRAAKATSAAPATGPSTSPPPRATASSTPTPIRSRRARSSCRRSRPSRRRRTSPACRSRSATSRAATTRRSRRSSSTCRATRSTCRSPTACCSAAWSC